MLLYGGATERVWERWEGLGEGGGGGHLEDLIHEALLLGQGLPVLLQLLHAAPHLRGRFFFLQASLAQLTHLPQRRHCMRRRATETAAATIITHVHDQLAEQASAREMGHLCVIQLPEPMLAVAQRIPSLNCALVACACKPVLNLLHC